MSDEELIDALAKAIATSIFDGVLPSPANVVDYRTEAVAALAVVAPELEALRAENARLTKERDNALHRAAEYRDECNTLRNENTALCIVNARLTKEAMSDYHEGWEEGCAAMKEDNARLREALKPFAEVGECESASFSYQFIRAARAAMGESDE